MSIKILKSKELSYDIDANTFLSATSITNTIQMMAINDLVVDLKNFNLWNKMIAIYPIVGGSATTHKYNLKDPRDLDAAYRLSFSGGWIHSNTGMQPNGTTGYANTFIIPSTNLSLNNTHLSYYSRTDTIGGNKCEMGVANASSNYLFLAIKLTGANFFYGDINQTIEDFVSGNISSLGWHVASRTASNVKKLQKNNTILLNGTTVSSGLSTNSLLIGCWNNNGSITYFSDRECAFATIGEGLSIIDMANLYTCIQKYQAYLNRQV